LVSRVADLVAGNSYEIAMRSDLLEPHDKPLLIGQVASVEGGD
jgi:hypothetical protein